MVDEIIVDRLSPTELRRAKRELALPRAEIIDPFRAVQMVQTLQIAPVPHQLSLEVHRQFYDTMIKSRDVDLPIRYLGASPTFDGTRLFSGSQTDWAMMNLADDPLFQKGKLPLPRNVRVSLQQARKAGIEFDNLVIAHELPKGSLKQGQHMPLELVAPPPPKRMARRLAVLDMASAAIWGSAVVAVAAPLALASFAVGMASLDPVLFGQHIDPNVTDHRGQPIALYYYLTHWTWNED
jgi:hypothetical protein